MRGVKKIVLAVDSFKGSLTSLEVAEAVEKGIRDVLPEVEVCKLSVADGGEGTLAAVAACGCWERLGVRITDSLGRPREGVFCIRDSEALIETAQACGLTLLEENERNPEITTSYGVGELLGYALGQGCRRIYIGLGGSATNDGGMGMLRALGVRFLTPAGVELPGRGMDLRKVSQIDLSGLDVRLREVEIIVMCDVDNPLTGEQGGSKVYGKQKGGTDEMLEELDKGMENYADVIAATIGRDERNVPGAGAAGGLGFAIHTLLRGRIMPGIEEILEIGDFGKMMENADLVITGEGRIDAQTLCGKAPMGVMKRAKREGVPVLGICGVMEEGIIEKMKEVGFEDILPTLPSGTSRDEGMKKEVAEKNIRETIRQYMIMHHV